MRKQLLILALAALFFSAAGSARAQEQNASGANAAKAQARVVGEVTALDAAARALTVRTNEGQTVVIQTAERTAVLRLPPGETTADKAARITLSDIAVGDRLFARGEMSEDQKSLAARQVVVTSGGGARAASASPPRDSEEWRRRNLSGRVTALNPQSKEITVAARSREGMASVVIAANGSNVRFLRFAPDSSKLSDARPASFADLKLGDQVRARGERSADGARFTAEEVIAGSMVRLGGTVQAVNAASNEVTIKDKQSGQTVTLQVGGKSSLRRIPPEMAAQLAQRRVRGEGAGGQQGARPEGARPDGPRPDGARGDRPRGEGQRGEGGRGERGGGPGGGGRNFQEMFENLPAITVADLKKGDAVFVVGTPGDAPTRATVVTLLTGEAEFMERLQQFQGRPNRDGRGSNPGLPGDVLGGGGTNRDQPPSQPR
jgi:hypothetical protein